MSPPNERPPRGGAIHDLVVVGAGPCGIAAGTAARKAGLATLLVDKGFITDSLVHYPPYMTFFSTAEKLEVGDVPFVVPQGKPTRLEALAYYRRVVEHHELQVLQHTEVGAIEGEAGDFRVRTRSRHGTDGVVQARRVVVATGSFHEPNLLGIPGEELDKVRHWYVEAHPYFDQDVLVVGGGNSAVEAALELFRARARVTLVHFARELDPGVKPWLLPDIRNRLDSGEIQVRWGHRLVEVRPGVATVRDESSGRREEVPNDWVFALTGWKGDPALLRRAGVRIDPETGVPEHDPRTMETAVPGLYIAGVLAAGHDANRVFIENGREHGPRIVGHLNGGARGG